MRGRLIDPFLAELAPLDVIATADAGYDADFRETKKKKDGTSTRTEADLIRVPAQIEVQSYDRMVMFANGANLDKKLALVFHFRYLEDAGLVDPDTGEPTIRTNTRLNAIYTTTGRLVLKVRNPPGLFSTDVQSQSFGLGLSRNLLIVTFDDREQGKSTP